MKFKNIFLIGLIPATLWAQAPADLPAYQIQALQQINTRYNEYAPIPLQGGLLFTSDRKAGKALSCRIPGTNRFYSDLYFTEKQGSIWSELVKVLPTTVNGRYHDGAAAISPGSRQMFFSRSNPGGKNNEGWVNLKLFVADNDQGVWAGVREWPYNSMGKNNCHPALSADGKTLVFASDRDGSTGGMDLYISIFENGQWTEPRNLGPEINTAGNELFPSIGADNTLYFASNGHPGLGGLDIFQSKIKDGAWQLPEAMPSPLNSSSDDFSLVVLPDGRQGYFASDRTGNDDLYSWINTTPPSQTMTLCLKDEKSGQVISDAMVFVNGNRIMAGIDNSWQWQVQKDQSYLLEVNQAGYAPLRISRTGKVWLDQSADQNCLSIQPLEANLTIRVIDKATGKPIPAATLDIEADCGIALQSLADASGEAKWKGNCPCQLSIKGQKEGYSNQLVNNKISCEQLSGNTIVLELEKVAPKPEPAKYYVGQVIELENLYYDYNQSFIRPDAALILDNVVDIMQQYPGMTIELGSHTDARGNDEYNRKLSQRRADAAVKYLTGKGIDPARLQAAGYGESRIKNQCANGVTCSDPEHEQNRRTEIKIVKM